MNLLNISHLLRRPPATTNDIVTFITSSAIVEEMDNGTQKKWGFRGNAEQHKSIRGSLSLLMSNLNVSDDRPVIRMLVSEPSAYPCFTTTQIAADAISDAVNSTKFNSYPPTEGILPARRAIAKYLSEHLPEMISPDDVFLTMGCQQAAQIIINVLGGSNLNILLPKPCFPFYDVLANKSGLEIRFFDLIPDKNWEADLDAVTALADENTVAMVMVNPGNPTASVNTYNHLKKVAETARKLGILVISDEVYAHIVFGEEPFVPMGVFASITPVVTLGSISKRWLVPGWRCGWIATHDPDGILKKQGIIKGIMEYLHMSPYPPAIIQGALPDLLSKTKDEFFSRILKIIKEDANTCYEGIKDIPGITCPTRPQGAMCFLVKLDLSVFEDIEDDLDFCLKLVKEESLLFLPGVCLGFPNWIRITFAVDPSYLEDGIKRFKSFCGRHSKKSLTL